MDIKATVFLHQETPSYNQEKPSHKLQSHVMPSLRNTIGQQITEFFFFIDNLYFCGYFLVPILNWIDLETKLV